MDKRKTSGQRKPGVINLPSVKPIDKKLEVEANEEMSEE